jgi:hypothetical protein
MIFQIKIVILIHYFNINLKVKKLKNQTSLNYQIWIILKLWCSTENIIYLKCYFKNFSLNLNNNEELMKIVIIIFQSINYKKNTILSNNKHLIFHKIINQLKIYSKSFNDSK